MGRRSKDHFPRRYWKPEEDALLRECYGKVEPKELAKRLNRSVPSVHAHAQALGMHRPRVFSKSDGPAKILALVAEGYSDMEIAKRVGTSRRNVSWYRLRAGLQHNQDHPRQVERRREFGRKMQAQYGHPGSISYKRTAAQFAAESGWPAHLNLRLREAQILNFLAARGVPVPGIEIALAIGCRVLHQLHQGHPAMRSTQKRRGYLNELIHLGLVVRLPAAGMHRRSNAGRPGRRVDLYALGTVALSILLERARSCTTSSE